MSAPGPNSISNDEYICVLRTILTFLKNQNFNTTTDAFESECIERGFATLASLNSKSPKSFENNGQEENTRNQNIIVGYSHTGNGEESADELIKEAKIQGIPHHGNIPVATRRRFELERSSRSAGYRYESPPRSIFKADLKDVKSKENMPDIGTFEGSYHKLKEDNKKLTQLAAELTKALQNSVKGYSQNLNAIIENCKQMYPELFIDKDPEDSQQQIPRSQHQSPSDVFADSLNAEYLKNSFTDKQDFAEVILQDGPDVITISPKKTSTNITAGSDGVPLNNENYNKYFKLNFKKVKNDLENGNVDTVLKLVQALKWRISRSQGNERIQILHEFIRSDLLGLHNSSNEILRRMLATTNDSEQLLMKQEFVRLVNSIASLTIGRDYLCKDDTVLHFLPPIFDENLQMPTRCLLIATLEKLSLRRRERILMTQNGLVEYLVDFLSHNFSNISDYCLEYSTALFMNLCLIKDTRLKCRSMIKDVFKLYLVMLKSNRSSCLPYINSAMYALLGDLEINREARTAKLSKELLTQSKKAMPEVKKQLLFIVKKHLEGKEPMENPTEEYNNLEEEFDLLEPELNDGEPNLGAPDGEKFLNNYRAPLSPIDLKEENNSQPLISILSKPRINSAEFSSSSSLINDASYTVVREEQVAEHPNFIPSGTQLKGSPTRPIYTKRTVGDDEHFEPSFSDEKNVSKGSVPFPVPRKRGGGVTATTCGCGVQNARSKHSVLDLLPESNCYCNTNRKQSDAKLNRQMSIPTADNPNQQPDNDFADPITVYCTNYAGLTNGCRTPRPCDCYAFSKQLRAKKKEEKNKKNMENNISPKVPSSPSPYAVDRVSGTVLNLLLMLLQNSDRLSGDNTEEGLCSVAKKYSALIPHNLKRAQTFEPIASTKDIRFLIRSNSAPEFTYLLDPATFVPSADFVKALFRFHQQHKNFLDDESSFEISVLTRNNFLVWNSSDTSTPSPTIKTHAPPQQIVHPQPRQCCPCSSKDDKSCRACCCMQSNTPRVPSSTITEETTEGPSSESSMEYGCTCCKPQYTLSGQKIVPMCFCVHDTAEMPSAPPPSPSAHNIESKESYVQQKSQSQELEEAAGSQTMNVENQKPEGSFIDLIRNNGGSHLEANESLSKQPQRTPSSQKRLSAVHPTVSVSFSAFDNVLGPDITPSESKQSEEIGNPSDARIAVELADPKVTLPNENPNATVGTNLEVANLPPGDGDTTHEGQNKQKKTKQCLTCTIKIPTDILNKKGGRALCKSAPCKIEVTSTDWDSACSCNEKSGKTNICTRTCPPSRSEIRGADRKTFCCSRYPPIAPTHSCTPNYPPKPCAIQPLNRKQICKLETDIIFDASSQNVKISPEEENLTRSSSWPNNSSSSSEPTTSISENTCVCATIEISTQTPRSCPQKGTPSCGISQQKTHRNSAERKKKAEKLLRDFSNCCENRVNDYVYSEETKQFYYCPTTNALFPKQRQRPTYSRICSFVEERCCQNHQKPNMCPRFRTNTTPRCSRGPPNVRQPPYDVKLFPSCYKESYRSVTSNKYICSCYDQIISETNEIPKTKGTCPYDLFEKEPLNSSRVYKDKRYRTPRNSIDAYTYGLFSAPDTDNCYNAFASRPKLLRTPPL